MPTGQPPPNPYDFLYDTPAPKKSLLPNPSSNKTRLLFVIAGGGILLVLIVLGFSLIFGIGKLDTSALYEITKQQAEIVRVAELGSTKAKDNATKAFAQTTKLSVLSAQQDTIDFAKKHGRKISEKELAQKNNQNDSALAAAEQAGRYDDAITEILKTSLAEYQQNMKKAFDAASNQEQRQLLDRLYTQASSLLL